MNVYIIPGYFILPILDTAWYAHFIDASVIWTYSTIVHTCYEYILCMLKWSPSKIECVLHKHSHKPMHLVHHRLLLLLFFVKHIWLFFLRFISLKPHLCLCFFVRSIIVFYPFNAINYMHFFRVGLVHLYKYFFFLLYLQPVFSQMIFILFYFLAHAWSIRIRINGIFVQNSEISQTSNKFKFLYCMHISMGNSFFIWTNYKKKWKKRKKNSRTECEFGWMCVCFYLFKS